MDAVTSQIRSVLISTKGKSDLRQLQKDYKMLMGEDIPYRKLGYSDLETFIKDVPTLKVTQASNGNLLIEAIPTNKTKHMVQLVNKQKPSKKKSGGSGRLPPRLSTRQSVRVSRKQNCAQSPANQQWRAPFVSRAKTRPHVHQIVVSVNNTKSETNGGSVQQRLVRNVPLAPSSPPHSTPAENSARKNPKLVRSASTPHQSSSQRDQWTPPPPIISSTATSPTTITAPSQKVLAPCINDSRPRMRFINNIGTPSPPPHILPVMGPIAGSRHSAPSLSQTEMYTLMKDAVAQCHPTSNSLLWSSSDESISSKNEKQNSPKNDIKQNSPIEIPFMRRCSDTTAVRSRPESIVESGPVGELKEFAKANGLGEVIIRVLPRKSKKNRTQQLFDCSIKVDNQLYSSYPRDCGTRSEAEAEAASQALSELSTRYSADRKNKKLLLATERDVLTRIPPIIERHFHGVWASQLVLDYEDKYGEQLPVNWLSLIDTLPTISVEPTLDNRYVLKVCKIGEKNILSNPAKSQQLSSDVSVPSNKIKLSEEGWSVQVTCALSTIEIWCRMIGSKEAGKYVSISEAMQEYYNSFGNISRATNVAAGGFYVVQFDNCWSRVRVLSAGEHDVTCFFIDFGDEQVVSRSDMYELKREFAKEQAQAFVCRLSGLEELTNMKAAQPRLEKIAGKTYLAKPQLHEAKEISDGPEAISIILYDTENSEDGDVAVEEEDDVNRLLIRQITHDSVTRLDPHNINHVYVVHATDTGDLYIQIHSEAFNKIDELSKTLNVIDFNKELPGPHIPPTNSPEAKSEKDQQTLYLAKWNHEHGDGQLYRTRITDRSPCGNYAQLYFIDYGNTQIINLNNTNYVYPLEKISEVLNAFPPLVTRVRLNLDFEIKGSGFANKVKQLMPSEQLVLLKVVTLTEDELGPVALCEMFRRSESENELISVNSSLRYPSFSEDSQMEEKFEDGNNNDKATQLVRKLERLRTVSSCMDNKPVPSTGELSTPTLPGPGSQLDVRIPFAVNPWNFFVQPYDTAPDLLRLMEQLQHRYDGNKRRNHERVHLEDVVPGKIYASKHSDGIWYRTSVIKVINSGSISVFYCDVGYYANLTVEQLVPLDSEFGYLPYQAIKARLAGIKPKDSKWTMDDCKYFENLVRTKNFVSVIVAVQQDELYKCDTVLVLKLIDTSTATDIHIDEMLIRAGIAAKA